MRSGRTRGDSTSQHDDRQHCAHPYVRRLARGPAESVAGTGITVNSVRPGPATSRGVGDFVEGMAQSSGKTFDQVEAEFVEHARPSSLIERCGTPDEVASLVAYVASELASMAA